MSKHIFSNLTQLIKCELDSLIPKFFDCYIYIADILNALADISGYVFTHMILLIEKLIGVAGAGSYILGSIIFILFFYFRNTIFNMTISKIINGFLSKSDEDEQKNELKSFF